MSDGSYIFVFSPPLGAKPTLVKEETERTADCEQISVFSVFSCKILSAAKGAQILNAFRSRGFDLKRIVAILLSTVTLLACSPHHSGRLASSYDGGPVLLAGTELVRSPKVVDDVEYRKELDAIISRSLKEQAKRLAVPPAIVPVSDNDLEIRIWAGFALTGTKCFALKHTRESSGATFYDFKLHPSPRSPRDPMVLEPLRKELPPPRSGWTNFLEFLRQKGVDREVSLPPNGSSESDPDETMVVIEVFSSAGYSMRFYSWGRPDNGSRIVKQISTRIRQDFGTSF